MQTPEENREAHLPMPHSSAARELTHPSLLVSDVGQGALENIREILVGSPLRDVERKLVRLEERLRHAQATGLEELNGRLEALERLVKHEADALGARLQAERVAREEATHALAQQLKELAGALEKRLTQLDDQATRGQRELHHQLLEHARELREACGAKHRTLAETLEQELRALQAEKLERSVLAALLTDVAMQLIPDRRRPSGE
jgi:DNA anti-recombination protein RmuC